MKKYDIPNCKYYVTEEGRLFNKITNEEIFNPEDDFKSSVLINLSNVERMELIYEDDSETWKRLTK